MSIYENVERKINFLKRVAPKQLVHDFGDSIKQHLLGNQEELAISPATLDFLMLNLSYTFFRNIRWQRLDLFQEIVSDMLVEDFRFPRQQSENLVDLLVEKLATVSPDKSGEASSANEFLRYIFVHVMGTANEEELVADLGLGCGILKRVKAAAQMIDVLMAEEKQVESSVRFVPEIDSAIAHVMMEVAEQQQECPWIIDIYRLKYILESSDENWRNQCTKFGISNVFDLLLTIGLKGVCKQTDLSEKFATNAVGDTALELSDFLDFLSEKGLIFRFANAANEKNTRWTLADKATELTARAFAKQVQLETFASDELTTLGAHYQSAYIARLFQEDVAQVEATIDHLGFKISPKALTTVFAGYLQLNDQVSIQKFLERYISPKASPWQRRIACKALATSGDHSEIRHILQMMALSDRSALVRGSALEELMKREFILGKGPQDSGLRQEL